ncbi:hypothetical protein [Pseudoxanthomonas sp. PXM01]|uniref:hypothetical protein n=1 Tax=Pseudoxanthomonas sp. PXM01 TaxID=2769295 RepID=UPI001786C6AF|nr:hypothetical protein [Pseudoxanthomonas sp. PXM01]MBD9470876.1 hypothetical protein [Pseudoxanthomonas sp. PXM01]
MADMSKQVDPLLKASVMFTSVAGMSILGALYRVSNKHDVPMFSLEALTLDWAYWCGGLIGAGLSSAVWYVRNREIQNGA